VLQVLFAGARRFATTLLIVTLVGSTFRSSAALGSPARLPVAAEDLFRLSLVSDSQISPDGTHVAFVVSRLDGPHDRYDRNVWLVDSAGGTPTAFTTDGVSTSPRWSPDGRTLALVRVTAGVPQIALARVSSHATLFVTAMPAGAEDPVWSHDGKHIAFVGMTRDEPAPARIDFTKAGFAPTTSQRSSDVRTITVERYEANGVGYTYDTHHHVWVMDAGGAHAHALSSDPGREDGGIAWSLDDTHLAFASSVVDVPTAYTSDLFTVALTGGVPQRLAAPGDANGSAVFTHGGRLISFAGSVEDLASYPALESSDLRGGNRTTIVAKDRTLFGDWLLADLKMPGATCGPLVAPDDRSLITNASAPGTTPLVRVDLTTGTLTTLTAAGEASDCTASADGTRVAYVFADFTHPAEVHLLDTASGSDRAVTSLNAAYLDGVLLSTPQPFTVKNPAGDDVYAWFMPAVTTAHAGRRPTVVLIHGGPQTQYGNTFFHEAQYLAGCGYNVVIGDPRGSVGFGHPFEEALVGNWGPPMLEDVTAMVDAVVKRPDVDPSRLGVSGGSYGGYATLWIVGHTNRFAVAISERPASDLATQSLDWELASPNGLGGQYAWGKPWDPGSRNYSDSPLTYVENVHTPVLLLHSDEDTETPLDQTLDEFSALRQLGRTAEFVDFPHENHDLNRVGAPIHRVERLHILEGWLARYLKP
jgi:dipeptidyl aminopeptidase/acylaminoacyl peptidase